MIVRFVLSFFCCIFTHCTHLLSTARPAIPSDWHVYRYVPVKVVGRSMATFLSSSHLKPTWTQHWHLALHPVPPHRTGLQWDTCGNYNTNCGTNLIEYTQNCNTYTQRIQWNIHRILILHVYVHVYWQSQLKHYLSNATHLSHNAA